MTTPAISSRPRQTPSGVGGRNWLPVWAAVTLVFLLYALYEALLGAPTEATMGVYQRIFYYHVPAALTGWIAFFINFVASVYYLVKKSRRADALAVASAEVGLVFLSINLITGPIWAKPIWGIWWTWDARLTLTLVMWVMYVSYLILRQMTPASELQPKLAAALAVFFFVDVPIDYMAIRWWRTQHPQPVLLGGKNSGLDPRMYFAFTVSWIAFILLMSVLLRLRYQQELDRHAIEDARRLYLLSNST